MVSQGKRFPDPAIKGTWDSFKSFYVNHLREKVIKLLNISIFREFKDYNT